MANTTNKDLTKIIINKLTSAQYAAEVAAGTLSPDEFYILTDWTDEVGSKINDNKISTTSTYSSSKIDSTYAKTEYVNTQLSNKQDKLTAGNGITITGNVISSTATGPSSSVTFRTWEA